MADDRDTFKKTVDLPKSDQDFIEKEVSNFSSTVRRLIGLEKYYRTDQYDMDELSDQLNKIAEIGERKRKEWREKQTETLHEYNAEIETEDEQGIAYKIEDEGEHEGVGKYTVDWGGNHVEHWKGNEHRTDKGKELGEKLASQWMTACNEFSEKVDELTDFEQWSGDAHSMFFEAKEDSEMEGLELTTRYVANKLSQIDVKMEENRNYRANKLLNHRAVY